MSSHEFSLHCQTITRITAAAYGIRLACGKLGAAMRRPAMPPAQSSSRSSRATVQGQAAIATPRLQEA